MPVFKSLVGLDPGKISAQAGFEPGIFRSRGGRPNKPLGQRRGTPVINTPRINTYGGGIVVINKCTRRTSHRQEDGHRETDGIWEGRRWGGERKGWAWGLEFITQLWGRWWEKERQRGEGGGRERDKRRERERERDVGE